MENFADMRMFVISTAIWGRTFFGRMPFGDAIWGRTFFGMFLVCNYMCQKMYVPIWLYLAFFLKNFLLANLPCLPRYISFR